MFKNPTQLLAHVLIRATRFRPVQVWLHQLATAYKRTQTQDTPTAGFDIPESPPFTLEQEQPLTNRGLTCWFRRFLRNMFLAALKPPCKSLS